MTAISRPGSAGSQDYLLLDFTRRLADYAEARQAVHLGLSRLRPDSRRDHHVATAVSGFRAMVDSGDGQLFVLASADVVFVYLSAVHPRVVREVERICFLFGDDPALVGDAAATFARWFDVASDYDGFLMAMRRLVAPSSAAAEGAGACDTRARLKRRQSRGDPLTPDQLAKLVTTLARADLSSLVRRQPVCRVSDRLEVAPVFEELFVAIDGLQETVLPGTDLAGDRYLFRHLSETLDRRVLALMVAPEQGKSSLHQAMNLNVATILSAEFARFDARLGIGGAARMIVEVDLIDALADLNAFTVARDRLHGKGYRLCLDDVSFRDLAIADFSVLGADLVKVRWDPELLMADDDVHAVVRDRIGRLDVRSVVLNRVDARVGIDFGLGLGITLFQGRWVDRLIADDNRRRHLLRLKQVLRTDT